jgi:predicted nucleic acid-binding protein
MIIVDTNVITYFFLRGERTRQTRLLFRRDPDWAAPILWRSEFRNVLFQRIRQGGITLEGALELSIAARELFASREFQVKDEDVMSLSETTACSAYDCEFAALAMKMRIPLITEDRQILREFPEVAVSMETFVGT